MEGESAYLPKNHARVGILNDRRETIGVERRDEGWLFLLLRGPDFYLVGKRQLFEDDADFPGVRPG